MARTPRGTYLASIYVDGVKYFEGEAEALPPADTVVLSWTNGYYRPYFDLVQFYDLSSGAAGAVIEPELLPLWRPLGVREGLCKDWDPPSLTAVCAL